MAVPKVPIMINCGKTLFSRNLVTILQSSQAVTISRHKAFSTATAEKENERDPAPFFFNNEVQNLLKSMTERDYQKIFRRRRDGRRLASPQYKFMTDKQLKQVVEETEFKADRFLQMPPVVKKRSEINGVLAKDPALQGNDTAKYVFTDITYGIKNQDRLIVVREPDGTLRHANWDERSRLNQIYFPINGREVFMPKMFEREHLEDLWKRKEYLFILDRACIQMEPDDPLYQEVTQSTYDYIDKEGDWYQLKSTRHFGPMVFHLVWNKNIAKLFLHNIKNEKMVDNALLVNLYRIIQPNLKYEVLENEKDDIKLVETFIEIEFSTSSNISAAFQAYKEIIKERQNLEENIKKAHGVNPE